LAPFGTLSSHCVNRIAFGGMATASPAVHAGADVGKLLDFGRQQHILRLILALLTSPINGHSRSWSSIAGRSVRGETPPRRTIE
jgi:hypothetical protein